MTRILLLCSGILALMVISCIEAFTLDRSDHFESSIVNGTDAERGEFPSMVALHKDWNRPMFPESFLCGGVIVDQTHIVTTSFCLVGLDNESVIFAHGGIADFGQSNDADTFLIKSKRHWLHPKFEMSVFGSYHWDVAIIELESPITFNQFVQPANFAEDTSQTFVGLNSTVAGWGHHKFGGEFKSILQKANQNIIGNDECNQWFKKKNQTIYPEHMCTFANHTGACYRDKGGPLYIKHEGKQLVVGLTSWSIACNDDFPDVQTRVTHVMPWIKSMVNPSG